MTDTAQKSLQRRLEDELESLKEKLNMCHRLRVRWLPRKDSKLSGEVKNGFIYVYEESEEKAIETIRHEFLDYAISQAIEPYKQLTNTLIRMKNKDAYEKKEKIVEGLKRLLD